MDKERKFMQEALALAKKAWGRTSPNPMVGAVIVKNDTIIGRGYHHRAGEAHAEIKALQDAGTNVVGADIYVTLEPCSTTGRTPPCTEAIIKAGIKRVFIGSLDPNPRHQGRAVELLNAAGIKVEYGIEKEACRHLNEAFFTWITTGRPFVLLKMAMTLDGKIATANGHSQWITGAEARNRVQYLRQWADAIMVGGNTARIDKPSLTVRSIPDWQPQPLRIIVSRSLSQDDVGQMLPPGGPIELIAPQQDDWLRYLQSLGDRGITSVLVEGGGELAATLLQQRLVDKVEFHVAMKLLGGRGSRPVVGGVNPEHLSSALELKNISTCQLCNDLAIIGYPLS